MAHAVPADAIPAVAGGSTTVERARAGTRLRSLLALAWRSRKDWGFGLPGVYAAWLVVLAVLYPACGWYSALKRRRRDGWLFYLQACI